MDMLIKLTTLISPNLMYTVGLYRISGLFYIRYPTGYTVSFAGYRLAGYQISGRISGSSIHEIVDFVSNGKYIVLIQKIEKIAGHKEEFEETKEEKLKRKIFNFSIIKLHLFFSHISGIRQNYCQDYWPDIRPNQYLVQP